MKIGRLFGSLSNVMKLSGHFCDPKETNFPSSERPKTKRLWTPGTAEDGMDLYTTLKREMDSKVTS